MKTIKAKSLSIWNSHHLSVDTFPWNAFTLPDSAYFGFLLAVSSFSIRFTHPLGLHRASSSALERPRAPVFRNSWRMLRCCCCEFPPCCCEGWFPIVKGLVLVRFCWCYRGAATTAVWRLSNLRETRKGKAPLVGREILGVPGGSRLGMNERVTHSVRCATTEKAVIWLVPRAELTRELAQKIAVGSCFVTSQKGIRLCVDLNRSQLRQTVLPAP